MRIFRFKFTPLAKLIILTLLLYGCTSWLPEPHRIEIQQGNIIKQETRDLLKPGITKQETRSILGNAVLQDPFHPDRWDYIYNLKSDNRKQPNSRLTLFFKEDRLIKIDDTEFHPMKSSE